MLLLMLMPPPDPDALLRAARAMTAAEQHCPGIADSTPNNTDVTVCGRRRADRFRVPFTGYEPGDPRGRSVGEERAALLHRPSPVEAKSPFLVGGGMAGVTVGTARSGGMTARRPAP